MPGLPSILIVALAVLAAQSPEELLRRSDVGAFAPDSFRARLVLKRPPSNARHEIEIWRSGDSRTLIRLLDPKDRGKYLLRLEDQLWLLAPGAKEPVRVSPSYRLYGGVTLDEVLGLRLSESYRVERVTDQSDADGRLVIFELRAKRSSLFPQVRYTVREKTERPVNALYRLKSGKPATSVDFIKWSDKGAVYARRVIVRDLLRKGHVTEVDVVDFEERVIPDALFDLRDSSARRALTDSAPGRS